MKKDLKVKRSFSLVPEYVFENYLYVRPEFLKSLGIRALLIDIDNTLAPYEQDLPDEKIINWFAQMKEAGISCALISNNDAPRVELFNSLLSLPAYAKSGKPCKKTLIRAMRDMGVDASVTAGLGDQLLTDTLAVHKLGMISIIVPPIKDKLTPFFKFKRRLERPFMKKYYKRKAKQK
jgi:HAD superfamily phosphatase (TIGR01668 family)